MKERELELLQKVLELTKTRQPELPEDANLTIPQFDIKEHQAEFSKMGKDIADALQKAEIETERTLTFYDIPQGRLTATIEVKLNGHKWKILIEHFPEQNKQWYFVQLGLNAQLTTQREKPYLQEVMRSLVARVENECALNNKAKITITEKGELIIEREVTGKKKTMDFIVRLIESIAPLWPWFKRLFS